MGYAGVFASLLPAALLLVTARPRLFLADGAAVAHHFAARAHLELRALAAARLRHR